MSEKNVLFYVDGWKSRKSRLDWLSRPDNIYAKEWFGNFCVLAFCFIDLFCLKVKWNLVQTEDIIYVYCCAIACAAALDVPLAICALAVRKYEDGLISAKKKNMTAIISVSVFLIAFFFSFVFAIYTRDLTFSIDTNAGMTNTVEDGVETGQPGTQEEEKDEDAVIMVAALFNAVIPLLTSLSSYVISYWAAEPLKKELLKHEKAKIEIEEHLMECERALKQAGEPGEFTRTQIAREKDLYDSFMSQIDMDCLVLMQSVKLMGKKDKEEEVKEIIMSARKLSEEYPETNAPREQLPKIMKQYVEE